MQTVGQLLKTERIRQNFSIEDIEIKTRIRKKYITAIEESDWKIFPSKTYITGIIKSYGSYLKLDEEKLIPFFRREYEKTDSQKFKRRLNIQQLTPNAKTYFKIGIILVTLLFTIYFGFQIIRLITPPSVTIISPVTNVLPKRTEKIEFIGKTEKDAIVDINGEKVFIDDTGIFKIQIPLINKKANVKIKVTGANGKITTLTKKLQVP